MRTTETNVASTVLLALAISLAALAVLLDALVGHRNICLSPFGKVVEVGQYCSVRDVPLNPHRTTNDDYADVASGS